MQINIIGGGISGLTAAYYLEKSGYDVNIIEKTDRIGGRIKTDNSDGFLMDHGFQVFLTAYPEAKAVLNYEALNLKKFMAGAAILTENGMKEIGDPLREFSLLFKTINSPLASFKDKLKTFSLKNKTKSTTTSKIFSLPSKSTDNYLKEEFSETYINSFFAPFYKGIFLEKNLETSSQMFQFVFKMFSEGHATIPENGMEEIAKNIANQLKRTRFFLNEEVTSIKDKVLTTHSGKAIEANATLIATNAKGLAKEYAKSIKTGYRTVTNVYFSAPNFEYGKPAIILTPNAKFVNNLCCLSNVSSKYSENTQKLLSISVLHDDESPIENIEQKVLDDLSEHFDISKWKHIKTYHIPYALPNQNKVLNDLPIEDFKIEDDIFICGDHLLNGSINAAMKSGRLAAESIVKSLGK